jgi:hypothetical protein
MAVAVQHMSELPPPPRDINPALSKAVEKVLLKSLEKEVANRYESGAALMAALEKALQQMGAEEQDSPAILPPIAVSGARAKKLSNTSISDMLALELESRPPTKPPMPAVPAPTSHDAKTQQNRPVQTLPTLKSETVVATEKRKNGAGGNKMIPITMGAVLVIVLIIGATFLFVGGGDDGLSDSSATETQLALAELTLDDTMGDANLTLTSETLAIEATSFALTSVAAAQALATDTPVAIVPTNTLAPTVEVIVPTNMPEAITLTLDTAATRQAEMDILATQNMFTQIAMTESAQVIVPTEAFPNGRLIEMTYNSAGFYLRNSSDTAIRVKPLNFFALNAQGSPTSNSYEGVNWDIGYNQIDRNGHCVAIELLDQPQWTRPNNCVPSAGNAFNSLLTFMDIDQQIFWISQKGATQFAVLWEGVEVARCQIADGYCQTKLGN